MKVQEVSKVYNKRLQELMGERSFNYRKPSLRIRNEADGSEEKLRNSNGKGWMRQAEAREAGLAQEDLLREPEQPHAGGRERRENWKSDLKAGSENAGLLIFKNILIIIIYQTSAHINP